MIKGKSKNCCSEITTRVTNLRKRSPNSDKTLPIFLYRKTNKQQLLKNQRVKENLREETWQ